jgi:hypothetical protein
MQLVPLNKTCRYCPRCDLLSAHQDELEAWLAACFSEHRPEIVGNDYLVVGTEDRADWQRGVHTPRSAQEAFECVHNFRDVVGSCPQRCAQAMRFSALPLRSPGVCHGCECPGRARPK